MWSLVFKMYFPSQTLQSKLSRLPGYLTVQMVRFFYKEKESVNAKVLKVSPQCHAPRANHHQHRTTMPECLLFCLLLWWRMSSSRWCWMCTSCALQSSRRKCCPSGQSSRRWRIKNLRNNSRRWGVALLLFLLDFPKNIFFFIVNNIVSVCCSWRRSLTKPRKSNMKISPFLKVCWPIKNTECPHWDW